MDLLINIIKRYNMALLIIDLRNKEVECKANFSYIDNHIVLAFQAKDHMLEITGFITDCFNMEICLRNLLCNLIKKTLRWI